MKLPNGVSIQLLRVFADATTITEAIQYIGTLSVGKGTTIDVKVDPSVANRIFGITIDHGNGQVGLKRDLAKDPLMGLTVPEGTKWFQTKVPVKDSKDFIPTTRYPQNYMALVGLNADKPGLVRIWEIALVSQNGHFYVTTQCTYEVQCYLEHLSSGFQLRCPFFEITKPRPAFVDFLRKLSINPWTLPSVRLYQPSLPPADPPKPWPGHGWVLWWNCAMQWGVIQTTEGAARVHWSNVKDADGLAHLKVGDVVTYEELAPPFQTYERETSFKLEAFGVRQVSNSKRVTESWATSSPTT